MHIRHVVTLCKTGMDPTSALHVSTTMLNVCSKYRLSVRVKEHSSAARLHVTVT